MRARWVVVAVLVPLALLSGGGESTATAGDTDDCEPGTSPPTGAPVRLCGTTTVVANETASVRVSLPRDVTLAPTFAGENEVYDIAIDGEGTYLGVALAEDVADRTGTTVLATRGPSEMAPFDVNQLWRFEPGGGDQEVAAFTTQEPQRLEAGTYRLYLIAEGNNADPVRVTLRLTGLDGVIELHPSRPAEASARRLQVPVANQGPTVATDELTAPGIFQSMVWVDNTSFTGHAMTETIFRGSALTGYAAGYGRLGVGTRVMHSYWSPPDRWSLTVSHLDTPHASGQSAEYGALAFWLNLE